MSYENGFQAPANPENYLFKIKEELENSMENISVTVHWFLVENNTFSYPLFDGESILELKINKLDYSLYVTDQTTILNQAYELIFSDGMVNDVDANGQPFTWDLFPFNVEESTNDKWIELFWDERFIIENKNSFVLENNNTNETEILWSDLNVTDILEAIKTL